MDLRFQHGNHVLHWVNRHSSHFSDLFLTPLYNIPHIQLLSPRKLVGVARSIGEKIEIDGRSMPQTQGKSCAAVEGEHLRSARQFGPEPSLRWREHSQVGGKLHFLRVSSHSDLVHYVEEDPSNPPFSELSPNDMLNLLSFTRLG